MQEKWCYEGSSTRYSIQSTVERNRAHQLLKYMDLCFDAYRKFLNPSRDRLPKRKFTLMLYRDREEYKKRGGKGGPKGKNSRRNRADQNAGQIGGAPKPNRPRREEKPADPLSPFAILQQLKDK